MDAISNESVKALLKEKLPNAEIMVEGDGYHYRATIISDDFSGAPTVKRHKAVYAALNNAITSGTLHALVLRTYTKAEWSALQKT
ncbi:MAG TPA: BolA/IbaG family iron-sulfur metabolism protein [Gammaproteobacteria bacterium]